MIPSYRNLLDEMSEASLAFVEEWFGSDSLSRVLLFGPVGNISNTIEPLQTQLVIYDDILYKIKSAKILQSRAGVDCMAVALEPLERPF